MPNQSNSARNWIVGLDLRPSSQGALKFAAWLSRTSPHVERLIGIHVLEEAHLQAALRYHHLSELTSGAREAAEAMLAEANCVDELSELHILEGATAERQLAAARQYHNAYGTIVGRQAKRSGRYVVRLGRVARRVLRALDAPGIVVPPDYDPEPRHAGPIMVGTNLRSDSRTAAAFGASMARRLGRELVLIHVVPLPEDYGAHYITDASLAKLREDNQRAAEEGMAAWAAECGVDAATRVIRHGSVVESVCAEASLREACMIVSGSRSLSNFERLLLTSIGSELAAAAPCPVAVVPPS